MQEKTWEFLAMRNVKYKCNDLCNMRVLVTVKSTNTCRKWSSHSYNNYETSGTQVKATRNIIIRIRASQLDIGTCIIHVVLCVCVYAYIVQWRGTKYQSKKSPVPSSPGPIIESCVHHPSRYLVPTPHPHGIYKAIESPRVMSTVSKMRNIPSVMSA